MVDTANTVEDANVIEVQFMPHDVPGEEVLKGAIEANLVNAVVIGWDRDGDFFFASTEANHATTLWLLAHAQKALLDGGDLSDRV